MPQRKKSAPPRARSTSTNAARITRYCTGGYLADFTPQQRSQRRWPDDPSPRDVTVRISTFKGIVGWAEHYTLTIEEEENPFVMTDGEGLHYRKCWDDRAADGFSASLRFTDRALAARVAVAIIDVMFSDKTKCRVRWDGSYDISRAEWNKQFRKQRDGD